MTDYSSQVPVRLSAADAGPTVQFTLTGNGASDDLFAYAQAGATAGLDGQFDAMKMTNPSGLNLAATVIPLSVSVPVASSYTLTAAAVANLAGTQAILMDNPTGTRTLLSVGMAYRFAMSATTASGHFFLNLAPRESPASIYEFETSNTLRGNEQGYALPLNPTSRSRPSSFY